MSTPHVAVVGAGPAGLAAAAAAAGAGARVTLVDSAEHPGGQYHRMLPQAYRARRPGAVQHGWAAQLRRMQVLEHPRCTWLPETSVWAIERTDASVPIVHLVHGEPDGTGRTRSRLVADAVVLATGAHDRVLPFPGWTLPGVYSAGAAQALVKGERLMLGRRPIIAGSGPFLLPVAESLIEAGARPVALVEAQRATRLLRGWSARPWELASQADKLVELARHGGTLARARVPVLTGRAVVAARGDGRVEEVDIARLHDDWSVVAGSTRTVAVDAVCVSHGFSAPLELAVAAGATVRAGAVAADGEQATDVPGVYVAGELTGVAGAPAARAEGTLAGLAAAGAPIPGTVRRARDRGRAFARRLAAAHRIGSGWTGWPTDDTVVCRCEGTRLGALRAVDPDLSVRAARLEHRAGLGPCQGRICQAAVADLCPRTDPSGIDGARPSCPDHRPIATPIRLGELAAEPERSTT